VMWCHAMQCHVLCYVFTNILEKTAACIFYSGTWRQWVPSKCLSVSSRWRDVICSKMVILTITSVGTSDLVNEYLFCKMSTICHVYCQNLKLPLWPACSTDLMHVASMCMEVWKTRHCQSKQSKHRGWTWRHHPACSLGSFWIWSSVLRVLFLAGVNHGCNVEVISITCFNM